MSLGWDGGMDGNGGLNNTFLWQGDNCLPLNPLFSQKTNKQTKKPRIFPRLLVAQCRHVTKFWLIKYKNKYFPAHFTKLP